MPFSPLVGYNDLGGKAVLFVDEIYIIWRLVRIGYRRLA